MPVHAPYLRTFAMHNTDLGPNRYDFRREESENIRPALEALLNSYKHGEAPDQEALSQVEEECRAICLASDKLLTSDENPMLIEEIAPWLIRFKVLGQFGQEVRPNQGSRRGLPASPGTARHPATDGQAAQPASPATGCRVRKQSTAPHP